MDVEMKVAIITYHRAYNYGSALQAYALNHFLNSSGIHAETIDYVNDRQAKIYKEFEKVNGIMSVARNVQSFINYKKLSTHRKRFDQFVNNRITLTPIQFHRPEELIQLNDKYDYFLCGSDQIWNPQTTDFDDSYLLQFVNDKNKCISYAPSLGITHFPPKYIEEFRKALTKYKKLSVREETGANIIHHITGRQVDTVLDPVFLLNEKQWSQIEPEKKEDFGNYILGYYIGDVEGMRVFARNLSQKYKMPVVVITKNLRELGYQHINKCDAGPEQFVQYVHKASCVVTNSFHAVAFSLIFKKNFWAFVDRNNYYSSQSRIEDILAKLDLSGRILTADTLIDADFYSEIDYHDENFEKSLNQLRKTSMEWLISALLEEG